MKRYLIIQMCQAALGLSAIASPVVQEVTVYPFASTITHQADLVIEEYVPLDAKRHGKKWTFKNPNVSKRTVWRVTAESNTVFNAWLDTDGNGKYDIGEPFGTSAGRDYPEIELSNLSPITPRINLVSQKSDRARTFREIIDYFRAHPNIDPWYASEYGDAVLKWTTNNQISATSITGGVHGVRQRIRVVRWLLNSFNPIYLAGAEPRVIIDMNVETSVRDCLTEADLIVGGNALDIDFEKLYTEVINWPVTTEALMGEEVTSIDYLIVVGDGDITWRDEFATNTVYALPCVITRNFENNNIRKMPKPNNPILRGSSVTLSWKMDAPPLEEYTSYRAKILSGSTEVHDTGLFRNPARWEDGSMHLEITNALPSGTYNWKIAAYNSKFSNEQTSAYTNGIPLTVIGE